MTLPNFIIIGAGRSGTTSLYHYLKQHPQVFMSSIKETNFFTYDGAELKSSLSNEFGKSNMFPIRTFEQYCALFSSARDEQAIGEASPLYLYSQQAAEGIRRRIPDAKLIAILRDPVERAYSSYLKYVREGVENRGFEEAIRDERMGVNRLSPSGQWHYVTVGFYHQHLTHYLKYFDWSQIALYLFDDLKNDTAEVLRCIFRFLGVDDDFVPDISVRYNVSGIPRNRVLHMLLRKSPVTAGLKKYLPFWIRGPGYKYVMALQTRNLIQPALRPEVRHELGSVYRDDVLRLQELIQRDLSEWLM
jgi:hypothetical protein